MLQLSSKVRSRLLTTVTPRCLRSLLAGRGKPEYAGSSEAAAPAARLSPPDSESESHAARKAAATRKARSRTAAGRLRRRVTASESERARWVDSYLAARGTLGSCHCSGSGPGAAGLGA